MEAYNRVLDAYAPYLDHDIYHSMTLTNREYKDKTFMGRLVLLVIKNHIAEGTEEWNLIMKAIKVMIDSGFDPNKKTEDHGEETVFDTINTLYRHWDGDRTTLTKMKNYIKECYANYGG